MRTGPSVQPPWRGAAHRTELHSSAYYLYRHRIFDFLAVFCLCRIGQEDKERQKIDYFFHILLLTCDGCEFERGGRAGLWPILGVFPSTSLGMVSLSNHDPGSSGSRKSQTSASSLLFFRNEFSSERPRRDRAGDGITGD